MLTNATMQELNLAMEKLNQKYDGNISLREIKKVNSRRNQFTLKAKSGEHGSRTSARGRKGPFASWEVHGDFFDLLFEINPEIFIISRGKKITKDEGNWQEIETGSIMNPSKMSDQTVMMNLPKGQGKFNPKTGQFEDITQNEFKALFPWP